MPKRSSSDPNEIAKRIVDQATGEGASKGDVPSTDPPAKNRAAVELGRLGGKRGGPARAAKLSAVERKEIARLAAEARWKKKRSSSGE